uniref:glutamate synthase (ferredoxin) n=1 Tax=Plectus sambesii TaxID=2011161 RepID=A0A914W184_9BILA
MVVLSKDQLATAEKDTLWEPGLERDSCGVGFIASIKAVATHKILHDGRTMLERMEHRGACACDNDSGDGAGVLTAIPDQLYRAELKAEGVELPPFGEYATGILFLHPESYKLAKGSFDDLAKGCKTNVIHWRKPPCDSSAIGAEAKKTEPCIRQVFVAKTEATADNEVFERAVYQLRKQAAHLIPRQDIECYVCSLSTKTIVYKGQFTPAQLYPYYKDLVNPEYVTYIALVHSRFSTNTFPSWQRAQPNRMLAHNGEINTLRGNVNLMRAREGVMESTKYGADLQKLYPVVEDGQSDSGCFDNVLEFLVRAGGRSLPEAAMTMVPEAWEKDQHMNVEKKAFYNWSAMAMEPWDGPALLTFTDGRYVGAILDRNGLRPARYYLTDDDHLYMSSEVGVADIPVESVVHKKVGASSLSASQLANGRICDLRLNKRMVAAEGDSLDTIDAQYVDSRKKTTMNCSAIAIERRLKVIVD